MKLSPKDFGLQNTTYVVFCDFAAREAAYPLGFGGRNWVWHG